MIIGLSSFEYNLEPCPFCGGVVLDALRYDGVTIVKCADCFAEGPQVLSDDYDNERNAVAAAVELWNKRNVGGDDYD